MSDFMKRNDVDITFVEDGFEDHSPGFIRELLSDCEEQPQFSHLLHESCLKYAIKNTILQRDLSREVTCLYIASEAVAYYLARGNGNTDELLIADRYPVGIPDEPFKHDMNTASWYRAWLLNRLCRNERGVQLLMDIPHSRLELAPGVSAPQYSDTFARALRSWESGDGNQEKLFVQVMDETDPERDDVLHPEHACMVMAQWAASAAFVMHGEMKAIDYIQGALEKHKEYWASKPRDWRGWVAWELCALAAIFWDKGNRFAIDSDYMPMHWVTGEFLNDVDFSRLALER